MNPAERKRYFYLWSEACLANEWLAKDEAKRREVTSDCMMEIRGPRTDSTGALGPAEITALFVYLLHLGDPSSLEKSADWDSCKQDYKTFNLARQADYHERELYGTGKNKLDRNRFAGAKTAAGGPLDTLDAAAVKKRHLTFASRHQKKQRAEAKAAASSSTQPKGGTHAPDHAPTEAAKPAINHAQRTAPASPGAVPAWTEGEGVPF